MLVDKYLANATELDVDALATPRVTSSSRASWSTSSRRACTRRPACNAGEVLETIRTGRRRSPSLGVVGLINIQYAVTPDGTVYIIEANPRVPHRAFRRQGDDHPLAKYSIKDINFTEEVQLDHVAVKEAVLPFDKFPGADTLLGPDAFHKGVMGIDKDFNKAYAAQIAAGRGCPPTTRCSSPCATATSRRRRARQVLQRDGDDRGGGQRHGQIMEEAGVEVPSRPKSTRVVRTGVLRDGDINLMVVTSSGDGSMRDGREIRTPPSEGSDGDHHRGCEGHRRCDRRDARGKARDGSASGFLLRAAAARRPRTLDFSRDGGFFRFVSGCVFTLQYHMTSTHYAL